ncbi:MAG: hypothetical protein KGL39_32010 [Patescibacteria group bacterium]|nr:hypothetical protein [Patescibacteria group bacterium]
MSYRKVGGLHFVKLWRFTFMFCMSKPKPVARKLPGRVFVPAGALGYYRE